VYVGNVARAQDVVATVSVEIDGDTEIAAFAPSQLAI
jgi:hypothetical protein